LRLMACVLLCCSLALPAGLEDVPPTAVGVLRRMAKDIQDCTQFIDRESRWGKRQNEIERWYYGPPKNVVWDAGPSTTPVRSPFEAHIEFSVSHFSWVPPEAKEKYDQLSHLVDPFLGDFKIRYEFDASADGITLTRALKRFETNARWSDLDRRDDVCWDRILRNPGRP
jgi:hypothetical protein